MQREDDARATAGAALKEMTLLQNKAEEENDTKAAARAAALLAQEQQRLVSTTLSKLQRWVCRCDHSTDVLMCVGCAGAHIGRAGGRRACAVAAAAILA